MMSDDRFDDDSADRFDDNSDDRFDDDSDDRFDDDSDDHIDDDSDDRFDDDSDDRFDDDSDDDSDDCFCPPSHPSRSRISIRLGEVTCCGEITPRRDVKTLRLGTRFHQRKEDNSRLGQTVVLFPYLSESG